MYGHMAGSCELENEPSSSVESVVFFDNGFAAPEGFYSNESVAINKLFLISES
jgi:hypothetical protein